MDVNPFCDEYNLRDFRNHFLSSLGPQANLKVYVSPMGRLTVTNRSVRMLQTLEISDPCVETIMATVRGFVDRFGNLGAQMSVFMSEVILITSKIDPLTLYPLNHQLHKILNECLSSNKVDLNVARLPDMMNVVQTSLTTKGTFPKGRITEISLQILKAFLCTVPAAVEAIQDPSEQPRSDLWRRRILVKAVQAHTDETHLEIGRYLHAFPERQDVTNWKALQNCKILLLDMQLNLTDLRDNSEFSEIKHEWDQDGKVFRGILINKMKHLRDMCVKNGIQIVANQKVVSRSIQEIFAQAEIIILERLGTEGMNALQLIAQVPQVLGSIFIQPTELLRASGWLGSVEHVQLWRKDYLAFVGKHLDSSQFSTLILQHWNKQSLEDLKVGCEQALSSLRLMLSHPFGLPGGGCFEACVIIRLHLELIDIRKDSAALEFILNFCESFMRICSSVSKKNLDQLWVHPNIGHLWMGPNEHQCICLQMENTSGQPNCVPLISYKSDHSSWNKRASLTHHLTPNLSDTTKDDDNPNNLRNFYLENGLVKRSIPRLVDTWYDKKVMINTSLEAAESLSSIGLVIRT